MRALVTGGGGFVGQWLARALHERGDSVVLAGLEGPPTSSRVLTGPVVDAITWVRSDFRVGEDVDRALSESRPDVVFHLAGVSFIPDAQGAPATAYDVNTLGVVRLLSSVKRQVRAGVADPIVVVVGSGMQYGRHPESELPLTETAEQRPLTVYAASKAAQEVAALQAFRSEGVRVVCTRSFNHSGVGHAEHFLLPALVRRALDVRSGQATSLRIGNAAPIRDYLHVSDVVDAYLLLAQRGTPGEVYNVCSGVGVSAAQLAADVLLRVGAPADITTDPELVREVDVPALVGSPRKLKEATGWAPRLTRADLIDDLINAATH